ncbi:MAG: hypothetical protein MHM6MM_002811 [Cercozoa sp. M6MM]
MQFVEAHFPNVVVRLMRREDLPPEFLSLQSVESSTRPPASARMQRIIDDAQRKPRRREAEGGSSEVNSSAIFAEDEEEGGAAERGRRTTSTSTSTSTSSTSEAEEKKEEDLMSPEQHLISDLGDCIEPAGWDDYRAFLEASGRSREAGLSVGRRRLLPVRIKAKDAVLFLAKKHAVQDLAVWEDTDTKLPSSSATFHTAGTNASEAIANDFHRLGLGDDFGRFAVLDTHVAYAAGEKQVAAQAIAQEAMRGRRDRFRESIKSRVIVARVLEQVRGGAQLSFDYVTLVVIASVIATVGLATDSAVTVVASMLVSPIMGPIMSFTFGYHVRDWRMVKVGMRNEVISLLIIIAVGFIGGICFGPFADDFNWPTAEQSGRGQYRSLLTAIPVAFFSGMGVAMSILGANTTSLVGVAISASLLPPFALTGMTFGYSIYLAGRGDPDNNKIGDWLETGGYSAALTGINIILIYFAAIMTFYIKEVAPVPNKSEFWKTHNRSFRDGATGKTRELRDLFNRTSALEKDQRRQRASVIATSALRPEEHRALLDELDRNVRENEWKATPSQRRKDVAGLLLDEHEYDHAEEVPVHLQAETAAIGQANDPETVRAARDLRRVSMAAAQGTLEET